MLRSLYPSDWESVSLFIRATRALHRCECTGQCGLHQPDQLVRRCLEINHQNAKFFQGRVILTAAHLCNCYPICGNPDHLLALCQRCHLRLDMARHRASRLRTIASPSYKSQRYRIAGKALHIEDLALIGRLPQHKRRKPWL